VLPSHKFNPVPVIRITEWSNVFIGWSARTKIGWNKRAIVRVAETPTIDQINELYVSGCD
jgi:hypothetical protein